LILDILIFALIAAVLVYRLNSVLGTRHGDETPRKNPFAPPEAGAATPVAAKVVPLPRNAESFAPFIDAASNKDGQVEAGLREIAEADPGFDAGDFIAGAKYAFGLIVSSYAKGDRAALKPLLSPKLYADFDRGIAEREAQSLPPAPAREAKSARIVEAHLGGAMAYITVAYTVDEAADEDVWTFTRDTRSDDPNWVLIETSAKERPEA
jgi:predicted lipid-binding transport protein (Tim44 family)